MSKEIWFRNQGYQTIHGMEQERSQTFEVRRELFEKQKKQLKKKSPS